jgi:hypothetical protein
MLNRIQLVIFLFDCDLLVFGLGYENESDSVKESEFIPKIVSSR